MSRPFGVVLAGGGARGFSHAGVLHVLEQEGFVPSAIVGVSMGAVVGVTYAHREDWFEAIMGLDLTGFPKPPKHAHDGNAPLVRRAATYVQNAWSLIHGWGAPESAVDAGDRVLATLLGDSHIEESRIPVAVCATDLKSGNRVVLRSGPAAQAVYASGALAGLLPPLAYEGQLLADGVYSDVAPVDVARSMEAPVVLVVDPGQTAEAHRITNGFQAVMRAMEICHWRHAALRVDAADLVLRPQFGRAIDTLDFDRMAECVEAGAACARQHLSEIAALIDPVSA